MILRFKGNNSRNADGLVYEKLQANPQALGYFKIVLNLKQQQQHQVIHFSFVFSSDFI